MALGDQKQNCSVYDNENKLGSIAATEGKSCLLTLKFCGKKKKICPIGTKLLLGYLVIITNATRCNRERVNLKVPKTDEPHAGSTT